MADSKTGKRPLVNAAEFRGSSGGGGGGGLDKAAKIKAGVSIAAILVAILFLAFYFGVFGGGDAVDPAQIVENQPIPEEELREIEEIRQEELQHAEQRGIEAAGS